MTDGVVLKLIDLHRQYSDQAQEQTLGYVQALELRISRLPANFEAGLDAKQIARARLHSIETRLRTVKAGNLIFTDEADARLLLSSLQPAAHAQQLLDALKASHNPEPKANVGGDLTIALLKSPAGQQSLKISIHEGRRQETIDRVAQLRQIAYSALRNNFKTTSHERGGR